MARLAFIASAILVAGAAAHGDQAHGDHASEGFEYVGCVKADSSSFPLAVDFFAPFTPEQCQTACGGSATYAAVGGGCYCDVPDLAEVEYEVVDESKCDNVCIDGEPDKGYCGGDGVYNLYKKVDDEEEDCEEEDEDDEDDDDDEDCEEETSTSSSYPPTSTTTHGGGGGHGGGYSTKTETNTYTVSSCPPEVPDCPYESKTKYTMTETNTYTVSSCPDDVPDCPYKPTYTHPPAPSCDGSCPDKTTLTPSVTPTNPIPCEGCGSEEETEGPTKPPVVTAAAGQNVPAMGAVALGALFLGML